MSKSREISNLPSVITKDESGVSVAGDIAISGGITTEGPRACIAKRSTNSSNLPSSTWTTLDFGDIIYNTEGSSFDADGSAGHFVVPSDVTFIKLNAFFIASSSLDVYLAFFTGDLTNIGSVIVEDIFDTAGVAPVFTVNSGLVKVTPGDKITCKMWANGTIYMQMNSYISIEIVG